MCTYKKYYKCKLRKFFGRLKKVISTPHYNFFLKRLPAESAFPPVDLDILHLLEYKLKQVLCNHELATVFRPKEIALALLKLQLHKSFDSNENTNIMAGNLTRVLKPSPSPIRTLSPSAT